jgi:hypothetical protein
MVSRLSLRESSAGLTKDSQFSEFFNPGPLQIHRIFRGAKGDYVELPGGARYSIRS